jgi:hypothetical protein
LLCDGTVFNCVELTFSYKLSVHAKFRLLLTLLVNYVHYLFGLDWQSSMCASCGHNANLFIV